MASEERETFDAWDRAFAAVRVASTLAGAAHAGFASPPIREFLAPSFAIFVAYSLLLYVAGWRLLRTAAKSAFYLVAATLDFVFIGFLLALTGGAASPFYRALYLWLSLQAFYFGRRGGAIGAGLSVALLLAFHVRDQLPLGYALLSVQAGGLLLHGLLVGFLADRGGRRVAALRYADGRLAEANQRIREEHAKLVQAEKLSSIGLIAAGVAHEINNPLSGVMGCVKALRDGSVREASRAQYFETVADGLQRIRQTVQSLLDYARPRPPALASLDVAEMVRETLPLVAPVIEKKHVHLVVRVEPSEATIRADRGQTIQALVNILLNAAHAVAERGTIEVSVERREGRLGIRVTDDGPGIPAEIRERVCDPFFTTKPQGEGTGLGLAITLGIARAHGGDVSIASAESKAGHQCGAAVTLWLPVGGGGFAHA